MQTYNKSDISEMKPEGLKGEIGILNLESLEVGVKISDVRVRFGHLDLLVKPLNGMGEQWVERHRVTVKA
jgi:hypothetical protein